MDFKRIKILMISLFISILCSLLLPFSTQASSRGITVISDLSHKSSKLGTYRALIIGINDYKDPKIPDLKTAVNDAKAMAALLSDRYGFQVKLLLDRKATRETIYQALRKLALSTKPDDSVLLYYAGHGELDRLSDDGWWIPADAKGGNPVTYLDNFLVQKHMRIIKARHVLLISDSCYSGTLFGQARVMPQIIDDKYYLSLYNEKSRWGMTSGNKTPVSDRGSGGHSVFAYQLLKELRKNEKPYVSTQEIYTRIAPIVGNNSEQTPICRPIRNTGDQGGEFIFVSSSVATIKAPVYGDKIDTGLDDERKQLELELKELELLKAKIEERKKIAAERKRIESEKKKLLTPKTTKYASISPDVSKPKVIERDDHFVKYENGVVKDTNTGLEWIAGPNRRTKWIEAKWWVKKLTIDGGGWRLPTKKELKTLHKKDKRCVLPSLFKIPSQPLIWTVDMLLYSCTLASFLPAEDHNVDNYINYWRGFAVRSLKRKEQIAERKRKEDEKKILLIQKTEKKEPIKLWQSEEEPIKLWQGEKKEPIKLWRD